MLGSESEVSWGCGGVLLVAAVGCCLFSLAWYEAGVKARVYQREGSKITQWEVFCGAQPIERSLIVHPRQE